MKANQPTITPSLMQAFVYAIHSRTGNRIAPLLSLGKSMMVYIEREVSQNEDAIQSHQPKILTYKPKDQESSCNLILQKPEVLSSEAFAESTSIFSIPFLHLCYSTHTRCVIATLPAAQAAIVEAIAIAEDAPLPKHLKQIPCHHPMTWP